MFLVILPLSPFDRLNLRVHNRHELNHDLKNAPSEPNDASRNAFRTYEACDNFYDIIVERARQLRSRLNTLQRGRPVTNLSSIDYLEPTRRDSGCAIVPKVATRLLERARASHELVTQQYGTAPYMNLEKATF